MWAGVKAGEVPRPMAVLKSLARYFTAGDSASLPGKEGKEGLPVGDFKDHEKGVRNAEVLN